jgi:hypothetical protein
VAIVKGRSFSPQRGESPVRSALFLLLVVLGAAACARRPEAVPTDFVGYPEDALIEHFGPPVARGIEEDGTPFVIFHEERSLDHSPDMIHTRTYVPNDANSTWISGPITTLESFEGVHYVVEHRFWLTSDRRVRKSESRIH